MAKRVGTAGLRAGALVLGAALAVALVLPSAEAFRVLGVFPFHARSHNMMFKALMETLAERGHEVVMLSPYPQKTPRANYTDLDLSNEFPSMVNSFTFGMMTTRSGTGGMHFLASIAGPPLCQTVFETQHFKDIMNGVHGKFDVVFTEIFGSDCWTAVAYKLKLPLINMATAPDFPWMHDRVGSVDNPSYLLASMRSISGKLTLWQRIENVYDYLYFKWMHEWYLQDASDPIVRKVFGEDTPPVRELVKRVSLVMVNRHVSINPARPVNPNVIHVGGLHLKGASPERTAARLKPDLRRWMDEAEHGVIFFSLGSLVRSNSLPSEMVQGILAAFAALPQRVLWKYEDDKTAGKLPANVRISSWLPQMDVLAHPKTILFITHGGLMGTTEALFLGVPMLGIPLFADQPGNVALYKSLGVLEDLEHTNITKESLLSTIRLLTVTDKYRVRAGEVAKLYRDRPRTAAEEAAWWTEYVVRNRGAPHLRPIGADLPLYQYLLLDVAAIFLGAIVGVLLLLWAVIRAVVRKLKAGAALEQPKEKQQ